MFLEEERRTLLLLLLLLLLYNSEIYRIVKTSSVISALFSTKCLFLLNLTFRGPCIVSIFLLIYFQQDATLHSLFISGKVLYIFRVVSPPIIRSTPNCIYSIWYMLNRYCYLPLLWKSQQPHQNRSIPFPHHTQTSNNSSTIATGSSNGLTNARYCRYSCVCS